MRVAAGLGPLSVQTLALLYCGLQFELIVLPTSPSASVFHKND